ncbi:binding partner of ACD11 1 isoform X3 [Asparagus officinalis]|nr:binding partner of ACD11 1 isoform X3 [Asparagus officinalis]
MYCRIMSLDGYTVEVSNLSPRATERDLYDFFSFSGAIEHIEIIRSGEYASTAYVTFKEPHSLETAVLLSGATIIDQHVCIVRWGQYEEPSSFWDRPTWSVEDDNDPMASHMHQFRTTPSEAATMAQEVVKTMLSKGYILSKDALAKAKAFDESHRVSATAAAKVAELSNRVGLTDKICAGVDAVRSVDQQYHVSETTKKVVSATGRTAASVASSVVNSSYFSAGAMFVSDALSRASKAAAELASHGNGH